MVETSEKREVKDFWNNASCGEELYLKGFTKEDYVNHSKKRYELEPEIITFGEFSRYKDKKTLEIGVGLGADHQNLAEAGAKLSGVDLTPRAVEHTKRRFELFGLSSSLQVADAENLPFEDESFDAIYSWGVLHHSPDTSKAIQELRRVLKPGGHFKVMIYHKNSIVGFMLWLRYGLLKLRPFISLTEIYNKYLESPGTKAYRRSDIPQIFEGLEVNRIATPLNHADLLTSDVGQRHKGMLLNIARKLWPRFILRTFLPNNGLEMMIDGYKKA